MTRREPGVPTTFRTNKAELKSAAKRLNMTVTELVTQAINRLLDERRGAQGISIAEFTNRLHAFNRRSVELWNAQAIGDFCEGYAADALYVTTNGLIQGREYIELAYRQAYPDPSLMGTISVELLELLFPPLEALQELVSTGTAIVEWSIEVAGATTETGYSTVTFVLNGTGLQIVQDTSP